MAWARENRYIVFTNDLDYGALLFATAATRMAIAYPVNHRDAVLIEIVAKGPRK